MKKTIPANYLNRFHFFKAVCFVLLTLISRPAFSQCASITLGAPSVEQPDCQTPSGKIKVIASSAVSSLDYSLDSTNWQSSNTFSSLVPGNYTIMVRLQTDHSCVSTYSPDVTINPVPVPPTINSITPTQPTCAI